MQSVLIPIRRLVLLTAALVVACAVSTSAAGAAPAPSPTSVIFNKETVGRTSGAQTVTIGNPDPGAVQVVGASVVGTDPGDFGITGDGCTGATLDQGESCAVEVAFSPQAGGAREADLEVALAGAGPLEVPLAGTGQTMQLTVPDTASFATTSVGAASSAQIEVKNASEAGVDVSEVKVEGADAGDFGVEGTNCSGYVGSGMGCEVAVRFSPTATGAREAQLRIVTDGSPAEYLVDLSDEGAAPEVTFEPGGHDFGLVETHSGGPRTNFTLRNTGAASVQLGNLEISGPGRNEFWVSGSTCWGTTLAPGANCSIEVQFNANEEGDFAAAVSIAADGVVFEAPLTARAARPQVTASPAPVGFGATSVGATQTRQITLTNTGELPVGFYIALVSGGDVSSFHLVSEDCTSNLFSGRPRVFEPGESCVATIAFEPHAVGAKAATVSFFGGGEGALQVAVEGTAVAPVLDLSPGSADFGTVAVGSPGPVQTFQLRNESVDPQAVDSATLAGADLGEFQIRSDACAETVLAPGEACAVAVRLDPGSAGPKAATLRVHGVAETMVAQLRGEGTAPSSAGAVKAATSGGRVVLSLRADASPATGKVTIGRARCESSAACVLSVAGLASGRIATSAGARTGVRPLGVSQLRLAAGTSAAITTSLPPEFRRSATNAHLRLSLRWHAGSASGALSRTFQLVRPRPRPGQSGPH